MSISKYLVDLNDYLFGIEVNGYEFTIFVWNLLLVLVPFAVFLLFERLWYVSRFRSRISRFGGFVLFVVWLLFFPNAAYLVTEVRHIIDFCPLNSAYDVCPESAWMIAFFFGYALLGWPLYVYLFHRMGGLIRQAAGDLWYVFFVILIPPLTALGVLLGLLDRWNSWQVLIRPGAVWHSVLAYFADFTQFINWVAFAILFYLLYILGVKLFNFAKY